MVGEGQSTKARTTAPGGVAWQQIRFDQLERGVGEGGTTVGQSE